MPDGGRVRVEADAVSIRGIDDGIGIKPAEQSQLFAPFHEVGTSLDRAAGPGSISRWSSGWSNCRQDRRGA